MPPQINDIKKAMNILTEFKKKTVIAGHERFIFPFLCGSYFAYRKVDVIRISKIAKAVSPNPSYLDVGCGYGDFLEKIKEYLPNAEGMEKSSDIFYRIGKIKPPYIKIADAYYGLKKKYDVIFVGWMEPGVDYRNHIAKATDCIITTLDQGLSLAAEFEEFGFERIAKWVTPSWIDINTEITNKYYSKSSLELNKILSQLRGAHNLWYVYSRPHLKSKLITVIKQLIDDEENTNHLKYDFESIMDDIGYKYLEKLNNPYLEYRLWEINF